VPEDEVLQDQLWKLREELLRSGGHLLCARSDLLRASPVVLRTVIWFWRHGAPGARRRPRTSTQSLIFVSDLRRKTGFSRHLQPARIRFLFLRLPKSSD
jgi:hypothetical protein